MDKKIEEKDLSSQTIGTSLNTPDLPEIKSDGESENASRKSTIKYYLARTNCYVGGNFYSRGELITLPASVTPSKHFKEISKADADIITKQPEIIIGYAVTDEQKKRQEEQKRRKMIGLSLFE